MCLSIKRKYIKLLRCIIKVNIVSFMIKECKNLTFLIVTCNKWITWEGTHLSIHVTYCIIATYCYVYKYVGIKGEAPCCIERKCCRSLILKIFFLSCTTEHGIIPLNTFSVFNCIHTVFNTDPTRRSNTRPICTPCQHRAVLANTLQYSPIQGQYKSVLAWY